MLTEKQWSKLISDSVYGLIYGYQANILKVFADVVHVGNHWILAQPMAHAHVPNFDVP